MNQFTAILILRAQDKTVENFLHLDHHNSKSLNKIQVTNHNVPDYLFSHQSYPFFKSFIGI